MKIDVDSIMSNPEKEIEKLNKLSYEEREKYYREIIEVLGSEKDRYTKEVIKNTWKKLDTIAENQYYKILKLMYYKELSSNIDRIVSDLEGNVPTISYIIKVSENVYFDDFSNYEVNTKQGEKIECKVRIDENSGTIAEIISARKIEFSNSKTTTIHGTEHKNEVLNSTEIGLDEIDIEVLKQKYEFQKNVILPRLKNNQEVCHKYVSLLEDTTKCTYSANRRNTIYLYKTRWRNN